MKFEMKKYQTKSQPKGAVETIGPSGIKRSKTKESPFAKITKEVMLDKRLGTVEFKLLAVLIYEQFKAWEKKTPTVCGDLSEYGIGRVRKHRGLIVLERLGYVRVERRGNRAPRVKLLLK